MEKKILIILGVAIVVLLSGVAGLFVVLQGDNTEEADELIFVVQSNSMSPGIELGDEIVYTETQTRVGIQTWADIQAENYKKFGDFGDVIIYQPYGNIQQEAIIHRAMAWIEYNEEYNTYTVKGYIIKNQSSITITNQLTLVL